MTAEYELSEITPSREKGVSGDLNQQKVNLVDNSSFFSWITVSFLSKLINTGSKRPLEKEDLGDASKVLEPSKLYNAFEKAWDLETKKEPKKRSLVKAILRSSGLCYWATAILLNFIGILLHFVPTLVLSVFVSDIEKGVENNAHYWIYAIILLISPLLLTLSASACQLMLARVGVSMKSMVSEAIYRKALRLSSAAKGSTSTGQLVNIMSSDTYSLMNFTMSVTMLVSMPVMLIICVCLVVQQMGSITWIAVGIYFVMMVIEGLVTVLAEPFRIKIMNATDNRVKLMNEVLTGIRVIKYYCWEKPFIGKIRESRELELKFTRAATRLLVWGIDVVMNVFPRIVPLICFSLYPKIMKVPLTSSVAFTSLSLFNILQVPFGMMPFSLMLMIIFNVSVKRITDFLNLEEVDPSLVERNLPAGSKPVYKDVDGNEKTVEDYDAEKDAVIIRDGYFAWGDSEPCLKDITTRIPKGSLVAVVGRVGSGKTSFVSALIGEMTKKAGAVLVNGSMSLSAQQAWLVNDTVRNNILFGKEYDEKKYKEIIKVCSLEDDLRMLTGGDQCEIGDRGINVSGGQKARISLARACYSDSDIVVMDDPIAAVDSHVGKALFNKCISSYMQGRTRILVTNATQYLSKCDYIIVLENQTISHQGTFAELKEQNVNLSILLSEEGSSSQMNSSHQEETEKKEEKPTQSETEEDGNLISTETKKTGKVAWIVYHFYCKAMSYFIVIPVILGFVIGTIFTVMTRFKLLDWSENTVCETNPDECTAVTNSFISGYMYLNLAYLIVTIIRLIIIIPGRINAAQKVHDHLVDTVMAAPVAFHDITPVGRILNRFNRDITIIDFDLPDFFNSSFQEMFFLLAEIIIIMVSTRGTMVIVILLSFLIFMSIQNKFRRANTDLQRIESLTRTPIFSDFQGVLTGSPSIRAYGHQSRFISHLETKLEDNSHCMMMFQYATCWLSVRSDVIVALIQFLVAVVAIFGKSFMSAGLLGAALSSCCTIGDYMKNCVKWLSQLEAQMSSVERVKDYVDTVKPEPPMITDVRPPQNWPSEGKIEFKDAKLRYRDGPLVMKGVNLSIDSKEKIGVVGRTGAGKSTMMIALFRITDLCEGSISIDGMDLSELGLEDVRRALCIIPQDPVLFSATVRFNLDPFNESTDEDIWNVLEQVELKDVIRNLPKGLDDDVHEGGSNFSVGERQLICMARALLRKPKILIMDEATASLDNTTDTLLQQMIRKQFAHCTTLTIAHRLNTIMDSTRVCVMDKGVVAEFDTPYNLLHKENGIFKGMVLAANDPSLFDMVPGCEEMKRELKEKKSEVEMSSI